MYVVKASGETEKFDLEKIRKTCLRSGVSKKIATEIAKEVKKKSYDGITTREILDTTLKLLDKKKPSAAARYDLKGSMFRLGPAGFPFEHFIKEILEEYDYKTKFETVVRGACVSHEIDVIAKKENKRYMVECKYHNSPGIYTGLKVALYIYARFLDLEDGSKQDLCKKFDQPWLVCNTKFSEDAINYAMCKGIKLIGWNYPKDFGLEDMIEKEKLYPITMLRNLDKDSQDKLASTGLVLAIDLLRMPLKELNKVTDIRLKRLKILAKEAKGICYE